VSRFRRVPWLESGDDFRLVVAILGSGNCIRCPAKRGNRPFLASAQHDNNRSDQALNSMQNTHEEIHRKARKGITALQLRQFLLQGFQLLTGVILARLLGPEEFGIYAISTFLVAQISSFSDFGLSASLIQQKEEISEHELRVGFSAQFVLLFSIAALAFCATPFLHIVYPKASSQLPWLVRSLLLLLLISPFRTVPILRLERNLDFSRIAFVDIAESISFQLVAVVCAYLGMGIWSFAIAAATRGCVGLAMAYRLSPWLPRFAWDWPLVKRMSKFGIGFQAQAMVNEAAGWATPLLAGGYLGPAAVGFLTWASSNGKRPLILVESVMRVTYPHISRIQDSTEEVRRIVGTYLRWLLTACGMWLVLSVALGEPMTKIVYTPKWLPGLVLLQFFAAGLVLDVLNWVVGVTGNALGMTRRVAVWVAVKSVLSVGITFALLPLLGKTAVPLAWVVASMASGYGIVRLVQGRIGSLWGDITKGATPGVIVAIVVYSLQIRFGFNWGASLGGLAVFFLLSWAMLPKFNIPFFRKAPQ
jgi:teichuronic acid exporter